MIYTDVVKDTILSFLQQLFSQEEFYGKTDEDGKTTLEKNAFRWSPDHNQTGIMIMDSNTEDLEAVEKRPALIISRAPIQWQKLAIDQMLNMDLKTSSRMHSDLLFTSLRVNCFSREGLEAEFLASVVFSCVQFFAPELKKLKEIFDIASVSIGAESIVSSDSRIDLSVVPVVIAMYLNNKWAVTPTGNETVNSFGLVINYGGKLPDGRSIGRYETDP